MTRPHIVFITSDQQRADQVGCYGNPVIRTPCLDQLAAEGVRCDRAYVANPLCMPSRASMLTGTFPSRHGVWVNGLPLSEAIPTLPQVLSAQGYRTAAFGKLHLTPYDPPGHRESVPDWERQPYGDWHGPYYGFDEVSLTLYHNSPSGHYGEWVREHHPEVMDKFWAIEGRRPASNPPMTWRSDVPVEAHHSTWVGDQAVAFLRRQAPDRPFFAWIGFPDPHHPFCPPKELAAMYDPAAVPLPPRRPGDLADKPPQYRAFYEEGARHEGYGGNFIPARLTEQQLREMTAFGYAQVTLLDENVGRILAELERQGLAENTIVIFTSDHGELLGEHGLVLKGPFMFEGLLRVPLIIRWPAGLGCRGRGTDTLISLADLMPTLLEAAGAPIPDGVQGRSFLPVLTGAAAEHRSAVLTEFHSAYFRGLNLRTLRTDQAKLTFYPGQEYGELYDLRADPCEYVNRWEDPAYADLKASLIRRLLDEVIRLDLDHPWPLSHA